MKGYIDNLERLGNPVSLNLGVSLILISLRKEFDSFVQNYNMPSMGKTINELHAMLKLHEQTLPKNNAPALHVIQAGKVDPSESLPPPVSVVHMVSPFLCSDDSESDTEMPERHVSPTTSTPEIPTAPILPAPSTIVTPSSEFPLAPVDAPLKIRQ
ncbi:hypothetical protein Tco_0015278 [Tanacetum coccineum]